MTIIETLADAMSHGSAKRAISLSLWTPNAIDPYYLALGMRAEHVHIHEDESGTGFRCFLGTHDGSHTDLTGEVISPLVRSITTWGNDADADDYAMNSDEHWDIVVAAWVPSRKSLYAMASQIQPRGITVIEPSTRSGGCSFSMAVNLREHPDFGNDFRDIMAALWDAYEQDVRKFVADMNADLGERLDGAFPEGITLVTADEPDYVRDIMAHAAQAPWNKAYITDDAPDDDACQSMPVGNDGEPWVPCTDPEHNHDTTNL